MSATELLRYDRNTFVASYNFSTYLISQINGTDIRTAAHDDAVQLLTDSQRFVRLVVEREVKGPIEPPQSPRSPMIKGLSPTGYMANRPGMYAHQPTHST